MPTLVLMEVVWALAIYLVARKVGAPPRPLTAALVLATAIPPLASGVWATVFAVEPSSLLADGRPKLIVDMLSYFFYMSVVLSLATPILAKGYRIPATAFALPQIPLAWFIGFVGVMQVTGVWL